MISADALLSSFRSLSSDRPLIVRSPGRVNIIGEHTDYNEGFVLPAAIDRSILFALSPRTDDLCVLYSIDKKDRIDVPVTNIRRSDHMWANYLIGVLDQLQKRDVRLRGFNCAFGGDIPIGAGLSSSAAVEAGLAYGLNELFGFRIPKLELVKLAQRAENEFVGMQCGIMDQYINIFGAREHVLRIDCRSLDATLVPFDDSSVAILLVNSGVSHSLASSEYNQRRKECYQGVAIIQRDHPEVRSLRDVSADMLASYESRLDPVVFRRCSYVVHENRRLLHACAAMERGDLATVGGLMYETHAGLRDQYEVSCPELDALVETAQGIPEIFGARVMGGGFGGCTINLVRKDAVQEVQRRVIEEYRKRFGREPESYITSIADGTHLEAIEG